MDVAETPSLRRRLTMLLAHPAVRLAVPLLILVIAIIVLHKLVSHVAWADVKEDVSAAKWTSLAMALGFTALCYVAFALYDILGVESVAKGKVPLRLAGIAGASGFAVSNFLGFSYLTGTAVRYRVYSSIGLNFETVGGIVAASLVGFWLGLGLILGVLLTLHPLGLETVIPLGSWVEIGLGLVILSIIVATFIWLATGQRRLRFGGEGISLPTVRIATLLTGAALLDVLSSALTLYVLMPADLVQGFPFFFIIYVVAVVFGIVSSSPGGLGVFEATLIAGLGAAGRSDVLAALLLYRLIYTLLPFVIAATGLGIAWALTRKDAVTGAASLTHRMIRPLVPVIAAGIALLAGLILLISGNLPADSARLGVLRDILPLSFIEASHLIGSVVGLLLIVIARGLYLRRYRAWLVAMALIGFGIALSLAKGLDWEEAGAMVFTMILLALFRSAFYRVDAASLFRLSGAWLIGVVAVLGFTFWIGLFAYSHVQYRDALWWQFALNGDASRFLRTSVALAVIFAVIGFNSFLTGRGRSVGPQVIPDAVRKLAAASPGAEVNLALTGDKAFLISVDDRAFLAYADTGRALIAMGDPVGEAEAAKRLIWRLREEADKVGKRCAYYSVSPTYLPTYLDLGLSILKIGEVARVDLQTFTLDGSKRKDFRHAMSRAKREGYEFAVIPASDVPAILPALRHISDAWLAEKQGEEKGFSLGAFGEDYLANFDHAVLRKTDTGQIIAFANLFQGAGKHELSLDLMRYAPSGGNFAMDALFGELLLWAKADGFHWFSLGAAPFSGIESHQLASLWNRFGDFVYEHGERFYKFEGLRAFKEKFDPVWTPHYLASSKGLAVPRALYEINVLISGGVKGLIK